MMEFSYISFLENIHEEFYQYLNPITGAIQLIVATGAVLYLGNKLWQSYAKNEPVDVWSLLRPFVVFFFVLNFSVITSTVEYCMKAFEYPCRAMSEKGEAYTTLIRNKKTAEAAQIQRQKTEEERRRKAEIDQLNSYAGYDPQLSSVNAMMDVAQEMSEDLGNISFDFLLEGLLWIVAMVSKLILHSTIIFLLCSRAITLCILYVFGPLSLALILIPGWESAFMGWLGKYVSTLLWLPLIYLVVGITEYADGALLSTVNVEALGKQSVFTGGNISTTTIRLLIEITLAMCVMSIPKISAWFIPESGTSAFGTRGAQGFIGTASSMAGLGAARLMTAGYQRAKKIIR